MIFEVLDISEREFRSISVEDLRRGIAASIACRAAIKINMRLDQTKMEWLLGALARTDYPMSCPHGPSDRAAVFDSRYSAQLSPYLADCCGYASDCRRTRMEWLLAARSAHCAALFHSRRPVQFSLI